MAVDAGQGFIDIIPRTDKFLTTLSTSVTRSISSVSKSASTTAQRALNGATLGFVALGAAAVAAIGKGIQSTVELASEVRTLQRVTGQSAESASALLAASNALGIGVDKLTIGFGLLSKNIVNGAPNLTKYGIVVRNTNGEMKSFDEILTAVIDKFATLPAGPQQAAFAMNVFGRSGRTLIPILAKGTAGIAELEERAKSMGLILSQDDVDAAKKLSIAQNELGEAFKGASVALGQDFIPLATDVVHIFATIVSSVSKVPKPLLNTVIGFTALTGAIAAVLKIAGFFKAIWAPITAAIFTNVAAEQALGATYVQTTLELEAQTAAVNSSKFAFASLLPVLGFVGIAAGFAAFGMAENAKFAAQNAEAVDLLTKAVLDGKTSLSALNQEIAHNPDIPDWARPQFQEQIDKITAAVEETRAQIAAVNAEIASVGKVGQAPLLKLAEITGQTASEFRGDFATALADAQKAAQDSGVAFDVSAASVDAFATTAKAAMDKAKASIAEFRASATSSLMGFTNDALTSLSEKTKLTVDAVIGSFHKAAAATRQFGRDVLEISRHGGAAGDALAQQLLAAGPAAAGLADFIAGASEKARDRMIAAFGTGGSAADKAASKITKSIVGTLDVVKALLEAIAAKWNITLDLPGADKTKKKVEGVHKELIDTASGRYRAVIEANTVQAIRGLNFVKQQIADIEGVHRATIQISRDFRGGGGHAIAAGGVIAGASGFITQGPTFLTGESPRMTFAGRGSEAVIPFDSRGIGILAQALGMALEKHGGGGSSGPGGDIVVHVHQHLGEKEIGESVTRFQQQRRMVRG